MGIPGSGSMLVFWDLEGCVTIGWFVARCYCGLDVDADVDRWSVRY